MSIKFKFIQNRTRIKGTMHEDQCTFLSYLAHLFLEWGMFQTEVVEKNKTHILPLMTFLPKNVPFMR